MSNNLSAFFTVFYLLSNSDVSLQFNIQTHITLLKGFNIVILKIFFIKFFLMSRPQNIVQAKMLS